MRPHLPVCQLMYRPSASRRVEWIDSAIPEPFLVPLPYEASTPTATQTTHTQQENRLGVENRLSIYCTIAPRRVHARTHTVLSLSHIPPPHHTHTTPQGFVQFKHSTPPHPPNPPSQGTQPPQLTAALIRSDDREATLIHVILQPIPRLDGHNLHNPLKSHDGEHAYSLPSPCHSVPLARTPDWLVSLTGALLLVV